MNTTNLERDRVNEAVETALFAKHQGLLHKFSRAGYARLCKAGVEIEYEDVYQHHAASFHMAYRKYDPTMGVGFPAYFGQACRNNFNKWAERLIREQMSLGLLRFSDMRGEKDGDDPGEYLESDGDIAPSPEDRLDHKQQMEHNLRRLSREAKLVVLHLIQPSDDLRTSFDREVREALALREQGHSVKIMQDHNFAYIGRYLGFSHTKMGNVRRELSRVFEVKL